MTPCTVSMALANKPLDVGVDAIFSKTFHNPPFECVTRHVTQHNRNPSHNASTVNLTRSEIAISADATNYHDILVLYAAPDAAPAGAFERPSRTLAFSGSPTTVLPLPPPGGGAYPLLMPMDVGSTSGKGVPKFVVENGSIFVVFEFCCCCCWRPSNGELNEGSMLKEPGPRVGVAPAKPLVPPTPLGNLGKVPAGFPVGWSALIGW